MRTLVFLSFVILFSVSTCWARDLIMGTRYNSSLVWQQKVAYSAIPLKKRVKDVFYSDPAQHIIRGIIARDLDRKDATAAVTAGGVGSSFVNIRLKSERGGRLNYQIEIYI